MKTEFKPVLISVDEMEFERHLHLIKSRLIPQLEKIKTEFLKLKIGPLTNEFLSDILFEGSQLIRSHLSDKQRHENNNVLFRMEKLLNEFTEPENMEISIIIGYPSVDDSGNIVFTDESIQDLKDFHSNYVCTEKGIELMELHRKAAEALNQFYQPIKARGFDLEELFTVDFNGNVVPAVLPYDLFNYAKQPQKQI